MIARLTRDRVASGSVSARPWGLKAMKLSNRGMAASDHCSLLMRAATRAEIVPNETFGAGFLDLVTDQQDPARLPLHLASKRTQRDEQIPSNSKGCASNTAAAARSARRRAEQAGQPSTRIPARLLISNGQRKSTRPSALEAAQSPPHGPREAVQRMREGDKPLRQLHFRPRLSRQSRIRLPLFKQRSLPLTLYVPADYPEGKGELWWVALEEVVARSSELELFRNGTLSRLPASGIPEKTRAFTEIYWYLRELDEAAQRRVVRALAERHDIDMAADCARLIMNWDEIRTMAADPS